MTKKIYYFNELREDNLLYPLSQVAKDILQYNECVVKMYEKYVGVLYNQFHGKSSVQLELDKPVLFSPGPGISRSTPQYTRISSNPESNSIHNKVPKKKIQSKGKRPSIKEENVFTGKENRAFSLMAGCKTPSKYTANGQLSLYSEEEAQIQFSSTPLDQKNFSSSPERKSTYMLFKCMPRYKQSSGFVEIETDISSKSEESPFSPKVAKCSPTSANGAEEKRSSKNMHFSEDSKTSDLNLQAKNNLTGSTVAKSNSFDVFDHEKEHVYELLEEFPPTNNSEPNTLTYLNEVSTRLKLIYEYMDKFLISLLKFRDDLKAINTFLECVSYAVRFILGNKNYTKYTGEFRKNISALEMESSKLKEKIGSYEKAVEDDIQSWVESREKVQNWVENFEEFYDLQTTNEKTVCFHQPLIRFESCHTCENNLKILRKNVKEMANAVNSRIRLFVRTAEEFVKIVKRFVKCLINIGILKPLTSML